MKRKKFILGGLSLLIGISLLSIAAEAQTMDYDIQMPATSYRDTNKSAEKADTESTAYNTVKYLGWVEDGNDFIWWMVPEDGTQISDNMHFSRLGHFTTGYYGNNSRYYRGWQLRMRMKTGWTTNHPCDVNGLFTP